MITPEETRDVQALLEQMRGGIGTDSDSVIYQLVDICSALCVSVAQLAQAVKKNADGLDDVVALIDGNIFDPMEKAVHCKHVQILKGQLNGEGRDFGEYSEAYQRMFDKDLMDDTAEELLRVKEGLQEGEEFDQEAWLNDRFAQVKGRFDGLRDSLSAAPQSVEIEVKEDPAAEEEDSFISDVKDLAKKRLRELE